MASGFNAMGWPLPLSRKAAALDAVRQMCPDWDNERSMGVVGRVADLLERDDPYRAQGAALDGGLDLIGAYRLMACLLAA